MTQKRATNFSGSRTTKHRADDVTQPLAGRTAIVTGASRGIGAATARALAAAGARVALVARSGARLEALASELPGNAIAAAADLADSASVDAAVARLNKAFGSAPDILVNNAGIFRPASVDRTSVEDFTAAVQLNLMAPFLLLRALLPAMLARGSGHIVTIGSVADRQAFTENAAYSASKYGARGLHEVLRVETKHSGVRATLVAPGAVDTPIWNDVPEDAGGGRFPPRSQMLSPTAVADAILFAVTRPAEVNIDELRLTRS
jgi:NADP-dependent 3-hydroxy acid dehydrogenase YdfG